MANRHGVDSKPNRELTKNVLRGRSCETCERVRANHWNNRDNTRHCALSTKRPEAGVCSQWKMNRNDRFKKQWDHKTNVAKKRKEKREAKEEISTAVS